MLSCKLGRRRDSVTFFPERLSDTHIHTKKTHTNLTLSISMKLDPPPPRPCKTIYMWSEEITYMMSCLNGGNHQPGVKGMMEG